MRTNLNGWQRLWILVSVVYVLIISGFVAIFWPTPQITFHRDDFNGRISPESRLLLRSIYPSEYAAREDTGGGPSVQMPNGAVLVFAKTVPDAKQESVAREYWAMIEAATREQRLSLIGYCFLAWLAPCLGLYALGWAIGWVYRGFRRVDTRSDRPT